MIIKALVNRTLAALILTLTVTPLQAAPGLVASCNANDNGTKWGVTWSLASGNPDVYVIARTLDGGNTWQRRHVETGPGSDLQFGDSDNAADARYRIRSRIISPFAQSAWTLCLVNGADATDFQRPSTPSRPVIVSTGNGTATLTLTHQGDNVAVTTFKLYRNTVDNFNSASVTRYDVSTNPQRVTQTGLAAGTYYYWLKVSDAANNTSWRSGKRIVNVVNESDTERPATPKRPLVVTASNGTVSLALEHKGDNVGVTTFKLFRNTVNDFKTAAMTPYAVSRNPQTVTQTGLDAGTYFYWLKVSDAANNTSWRSGQLAVQLSGGGVVDPVTFRIPDWENTGQLQALWTYGLDGPPISVVSAGNNDGARIQAAIDQAGAAGGGTVLLDGGIYEINQTLRFDESDDGVVLMGNGQTTLRFTANTGTIAISVEGGGGVGVVPAFAQQLLTVSSGSEGAGTLNIAQGLGLTLNQIRTALNGQYVWLDSPVDRGGQIVYLSNGSNDGSGVRFNLRHVLEDDLTGALVRPLRMVERSGIRDLNIEYPPAGHTTRARGASSIQHGIQLKFTADTFVHNVRSGVSNDDQAPLSQRRGQWGAHIMLNASYRCAVMASDFTDASLHGDGGEGYGISFTNNTTRCRIEDNTFQRLRHSILLQEGATANVVAFNYSRNPYHTNYKPGGPADLSFHGFQTANLVEGNVIERIHADDAGGTGQRNVIVRNCLYAGPLTLERSDQNAFIANAMFGSDTRLAGRIMPASTGTNGGEAGTIGTSPAQSYARGSSNYFDVNGMRRIGQANIANIEYGNWFNQSRPVGQQSPVPDSYYGALQPPMLITPTTANAACVNNAVIRANDFAGPVGAFEGRQQ